MKKLLLTVVIICAVIAAGIITLVTVVDPNQFKPLIVEQTKKATGMDVVIGGDIRWQFFPAIGFQVDDVSLKNPTGFQRQNLLHVSHLSIDVAVMPLLDKELDIGSINLDGADIQIETLRDGTTNLDRLLHQQQAQQTDTAKPTDAATPEQQTSTDSTQSTEKAQPWQVSVAGVDIREARIAVLNEAQPENQLSLDDVNLTVSAFAPNQWTTFSWSVQGKRAVQQFSVAGEGDFRLSADYRHYALRQISVKGSYQDETNDIRTLTLSLPMFEVGQDAPFEVAVAGKLADNDIDFSGKGTLNLDAQYQYVRVNGLDTQLKLTGAQLPVSPLSVAVQGNLRMNLPESQLDMSDLKLQVADVKLQGNTSLHLGNKPAIHFRLQGDQIDLSPFLPPATDTAAATQEETSAQAAVAAANSSTQAASTQEPDLTALKAFDLDGTLNIAGLKAQKLALNNLGIKVNLRHGVLTLAELQADLYQGHLQGSGVLNASVAPATYQMQQSLQGIQIQPVLKAVADNDRLEGQGSVELDLHGRGLSEKRLKENIAGTVKVQLQDGAVNGINVAQVIRQGYAKLKGKLLDDTESVQKTDFSAASATLHLSQGVATIKESALQSPLLRVHTQGDVNYVAQTVDVVVRASIVGTLKGQGGKDINELKDVTIPIQVKGSWTQPQYKLVFDDVAKQKVQKELDRGLEKLDGKIKDERTKKALNKLLKGLF
ncbi:AsmA family protein [Vibrio gazogenes]|uniref:AsmA protein n=1 Tax=Vibrio gazogenes DSM 21264 = NBRC 103151 TaxID=1123492 RepID=A0A1M5GD05_VIBGA|nr:AsmA family protein [Vibrio gazogenes]USP14657.1 AsmA family protein [Vibrio gazogenes]SHG01558.1 AsmA protein [Vibrio gazogenes DSM 21264] [Vibrio gazogenes DSM 21264 = NBRC 103151]SJN55053.1 putative assembly protein [Vibrio gazogenes]